MDRDKLRSGLLGAVGVYLMYTAYRLFRGRNAPDDTMAPAVLILFVVLFAVCGAAVTVYGCVLWRRAMKDERDGDGRGDGVK